MKIPWSYITRLITGNIFGILACAASLSYWQSCTNEGAEVENFCRESCFCVNGRMQESCRTRKDFQSMTEAEWWNGGIKPLFSEGKRINLSHSVTISRLVLFVRFLFRYEKLLRRMNCRVTLPYWDWSLFSMSPWSTARSRIWYGGQSGLGGNGVGRSRCVTTGLFRSNRWRTRNHRTVPYETV